MLCVRGTEPVPLQQRGLATSMAEPVGRRGPRVCPRHLSDRCGTGARTLEASQRTGVMSP